jgi:hypothetical protein
MFYTMWLLTETKQLSYQLFLTFSYINLDTSVCDLQKFTTLSFSVIY